MTRIRRALTPLACSILTMQVLAGEVGPLDVGARLSRRRVRPCCRGHLSRYDYWEMKTLIPPPGNAAPPPLVVGVVKGVMMVV